MSADGSRGPAADIAKLRPDSDLNFTGKLATVTALAVTVPLGALGRKVPPALASGTVGRARPRLPACRRRPGAVARGRP